MQTQFTDAQVWASQKFGIDPSEIYNYHSGNCFDTIIVLNEKAAQKIKDAVNGRFVNGGNYDGMRLGFIQKFPTRSGEIGYSVMC